MSIHSVPAGLDVDALRARLVRGLRAPSGVQLDGPNGTPTALEFTPDLSGAEQTTLAALLTTATSQAGAPARLKAFYPTARQWAQDAAQTNTNWPTMTAGQKDTAMRETIRRLGQFFDGIGDLLLQMGLDS